VIANEPEREHLIELTLGSDLIAPESVHWEIGNAFSAMLKRNRVTSEQVIEALDIYRQIPIRFTDVELEDSLQIVAEFDIYAYDAYLIRCALKYQSTLLTLDQKLARIARTTGVEVVEV
jgi:predicted nucleic acid-binding protein